MCPLPQTSHCCSAEGTSRYATGDSPTQQLHLQLRELICPQLIVGSKVHGHRTVQQAQCIFHCLSLSTPCDYKYPAKENIQNLACLVPYTKHSIIAINGCQREVYSPQRCQHAAASLAEHNGRDTFVLSYVKRRFCVLQGNSTEQEVSQGYCPCCTCYTNIQKPYIFSIFFFQAFLEPWKFITVLKNNLGKQQV